MMGLHITRKMQERKSTYNIDAFTIFYTVYLVSVPIIEPYQLKDKKLT